MGETRIEVKSIYTPWTKLDKVTIVIEGNVIKRIVKGWIGGENYRDYIAVPGFVDTHIHGIEGVELYSSKASDLEKGAKALVKYGVTAFLPTSVTLPHEELKNFLENVKHFIENPVDGGAKILGAYLEGPYINPEARGAQNPEYIRLPNLRELEEYIGIGKGVLRVIAVAPEMEGALDLISMARRAGIHVAVGHSKASYEQVIEAIAAGVDRATHLFNAMTRFHHREPGAAIALLESEEVFLEIIADLIHLHPATILMVHRVAGPRRVVLITDAISAAGLKDGVYSLGGLKVIVKDGIARLENGALAGSTLTMDRAVRNCISIGIPTNQALAMASRVPALSIGEESLGCLKPGCRADMAILDDELKVVSTWVEGIEVFSR